ncbi:hypothetical protein ABK040_010309 [Willaertia magna]
MEAFKVVLVRKGIRKLFFYIDDFVGFASSEKLCKDKLALLLEIARLLKIEINENKLILFLKIIPALGLLLDLEKKLIITLEEKVQFLKKVIKLVLDFIKKKKRVKIKVIASIVGFVNSFTITVSITKFLCYQLYKFIYKTVTKVGWEALLTINLYIDRLNNKFFGQPTIIISIFIDASLSSWSAIVDKVQINGLWSKNEIIDIAFLELKAIFLIIFKYRKELHVKRIHITTDSQTVKSILLNSRSRNKLKSKMASSI